MGGSGLWRQTKWNTVPFCWGFCLYLESLVLKCHSLSICPSFWWTTENILLSDSKGWQIPSVWGRIDLRRESLTGWSFEPLSELSYGCMLSSVKPLVDTRGTRSTTQTRACFHIFMAWSFWGRPLGSYRKDRCDKKEDLEKWQGQVQNSKAEKNRMKYFECLPFVSGIKRAAQHWTCIAVPLTDENQEQLWMRDSKLNHKSKPRRKEQLL